jgi:DNA-binding LacI/PurR family transcriptional regulator
MPSRRPTLLDVARAAGVSRSTVSYAYNQPERLSDDTRARVLAAAREVGYAGPDPLAASLRRGRAGALGVLITEKLSYAFDDPGAVLFLRGIASVVEEADVGLTLLPVPPVARGALAAVRGSAVDGVIAFSLPPAHAAIQAAIERRLPLVRVDMDSPPGEPMVRVDDRGGARAVAEHVLSLGHQRVAVLVDRLLDDDVRGVATAARLRDTVFAVDSERLAGYGDAFRAAGIDPAAVPVFETAGNTIAAGHSATAELLAGSEPPTALICLTDQLARGALRAAPELSVAGFDDLPVAAEIGLTTVHQDHIAKGAHAARMLLEPDTERTVTLPTTLVVRTSTRRP